MKCLCLGSLIWEAERQLRWIYASKEFLCETASGRKQIATSSNQLFSKETNRHVISKFFLSPFADCVLTYLLTYSAQQSPSWEANPFSASQETPPILWNPKCHYRIHKCPPPVPIGSQISPVHDLTTHFLKNHLNTILPFTPASLRLLQLIAEHFKQLTAKACFGVTYWPSGGH